MTCLECGTLIPEGSNVCEKCGWSWETSSSSDQSEELNCTSELRSACIICGHHEFVWGSAHGHYDFKFKRDDASPLAQFTVFGGEKIRARKCHHCGNIQLFVKQ